MDRLGGRLSHMYFLPVRISFPLLRSSLCGCRRTLSTHLPDTWRHGTGHRSISEFPATRQMIIADTNPSECSFHVQSLPHTVPCLHRTPSSGICGTKPHPHKYSHSSPPFFDPSPARRMMPAILFQPITYVSKSYVYLEITSAQGTRTVFTPCSEHLIRRIRATRIV